ncbi:RsmB/NOP family class I SAM-dependent RNA methyltransferase [Nitratidesulfovibrio liaohensis]|uniref:RsmB/NOP family class I SAM-dependent RNA methyltransferase n=1 Tax=Nitratidesulfovibrio liaohensis TaxID=2604158 RepID=A0ABY9QZV8_9BACT|nr:RsmB/NOP family class I SAM-dependent RNA methyltransferase [Nitratidesulfovibrio liaohensis]WMW64263.1 RsmB/NOP family class I SAM-dependent RNA methyltransferase [Nitratidesulfovibrio liaohensis]
MTAPAARSFRIVCPPAQVPLVEDLLRAQGYDFEPEPFSPWCRRLTEEPRPLGGSLAAFFGLIYIQDRSSMLPPLALAPEPGAAVLDMCASPGSKTGFLAQLAGPHGLVVGNEPNHTRLATLRQNLFTLNLVNAVTCSHPGEALPLPDGSWTRIQLDPPCSGWGTVERNPSVLKLWQGDKVKPLIGIQRLLLAEAARLLAPGGRVVFSTCTTNVYENEAQVLHARDELGLELVPLDPPPGFVFAKPELPGCDGTLRVDPERSGAQGFFIACLRKPGGRGDAGPLADGPPLPDADRVRADAQPASAWPDTGLDPALLPDGVVAPFGDTAYFLPRHALERLPAALRWRGYPLGKWGKDGIRPSPRLRTLMPYPPYPTEPTGQGGQAGSGAGDDVALLHMDDPADIAGVLTGRSIDAPRNATAALLYWHGLPLARLRVKGGRALWAER